MNIISTSIAVLWLSAALLSLSAKAQSLTVAAPTSSAQSAVPSSPEAVFEHWDTDKNKALSLEEFKAGMQRVQAANALRALHDNFVVRDSNKNDAIDASEYANLELIKRVGKSAPPMTAFDTDKNQALDFKEYVAMVNSLLKNKP